MHPIFIFFLSCSLVVLFILLGMPLARRFGLVDVPNERKQHDLPTPLIGGLAIVLSLLICLSVPQLNNTVSHGVLVPMGLMLLLGLIDDYYTLKPRYLLLLQAAIALIMLKLSGVTVTHLGDLLGHGNIHTGSLSTLITIISLVGMINAINMADGLDGLAGGLISLCFAWFALICYFTMQTDLMHIAIAVVGALVGFLIFNMRTPLQARAKIFLGNAGTMSLGLLITWFSITLTQNQIKPISPIIAVWIIGLPLMDMGRVIIFRILSGKSPLIADRSHLHYILINKGLSHGQAVSTKLAISSLFGATALIAWWYCVSDALMFFAFMIILALYCIIFIEKKS